MGRKPSRTSTRRVAFVGTVAMLATLALVVAGPAAARPPVVESAGAINGQATAKLTLPAGVIARFVQIASSPEKTLFGYFTQKALVSFSVLAPRQTNFRDTLKLKPGTYYLHVAGSDPECPDCPAIEFSNVFKLVVDASGTGVGSDLGASGKKPSQLVSYKHTQDVDKLFVRARMDITGTLSAGGEVKVPGTSKAQKLLLVTKQVTGDTTVKLRLKLSKSGKRAVKKALKAGKKLRAKITVTARDNPGRTTTKTVKVRLKP